MKGLIELPLQDTIDVRTAARMADVSESTVRRWCEEGRIAAVHPGGRWRIYRSEFLAWITSTSSAATLPARPAAPRVELRLSDTPPAPRRRPRVPTENLSLFD